MQFGVEEPSTATQKAVKPNTLVGQRVGLTVGSVVGAQVGDAEGFGVGNDVGELLTTRAIWITISPSPPLPFAVESVLVLASPPNPTP